MRGRKHTRNYGNADAQRRDRAPGYGCPSSISTDHVPSDPGISEVEAVVGALIVGNGVNLLCPGANPAIMDVLEHGAEIGDDHRLGQQHAPTTPSRSSRTPAPAVVITVPTRRRRVPSTPGHRRSRRTARKLGTRCWAAARGQHRHAARSPRCSIERTWKAAIGMPEAIATNNDQHQHRLGAISTPHRGGTDARRARPNRKTYQASCPHRPSAR